MGILCIFTYRVFIFFYEKNISRQVPVGQHCVFVNIVIKKQEAIIVKHLGQLLQ